MEHEAVRAGRAWREVLVDILSRADGDQGFPPVAE